MHASNDLRRYRKSRRKFALKTYLLLAVWLLLALIQWIVFCILTDLRSKLQDLYYVGYVTLVLSVFIFLIFIFFEKLRFVRCLNIFLAFIIVELQIIATFTLITHSWWADVLTFFFVCVLLIVLFLLIGAFLPKKMDLTLDIAVLFILAFIFIIVAVFFLMYQLIISKTLPYSFLVVELAITITILLFVMYHAQTIHGSRFAEMRLKDFILGSLILFHHFLIIFWLTFYYQVNYRPITSDNYIATSSTKQATATEKAGDLSDLFENDNYDNGDGNKEDSPDVWTNAQNWTDPDRDRDRERSRPKGSGGSRDKSDGTAGHRDRDRGNRWKPSHDADRVTVQSRHRGRVKNLSKDENRDRDADRSRESHAHGDKSSNEGGVGDADRSRDKAERPAPNWDRRLYPKNMRHPNIRGYTQQDRSFERADLDRQSYGRGAYRNLPNGDGFDHDRDEWNSHKKAIGSSNVEDALEDSDSGLPTL
ncbi:uncharacterized protein [Drosophila pseudoobscura]|uniref:Uncharacterized protein n=1 Tax=Drosophila pseudoobscura pseudoobscura TaxID=46245 RepID=A0A6I8V0B9_DROPS|nr:uncharacterized protein LOC6900338 [Drosophila pseudoobscura]